MSHESSRREEAAFVGALATPHASRTAFVRWACAGDAALCERVEALLRSHDAEGAPFDHVSAAEMAGLGADLQAGVTDPAKAQGLIGRYRLGRKIGEGGFGSVWFAEQQEPVKRNVAVKILRPGMDTREFIARFELERQALALMNHPNIARVFDAGATEDGRPYFVMELVEGVSITQYCDEHRLGLNDRLRLFMMVCGAVQHAHQKGIIHRDLKPSNILVSSLEGAPMPKVIDFGIAKLAAGIADGSVITAYTHIMGTPAYMSPEQLDFGGRDLDTRSDIYNLGVLLYELLTGRTPFDARQLSSKSFDELCRIIRVDEPPRASLRVSALDAPSREQVARQRGTEFPQLHAALRGDLDWIVMRCLEKQPARRYDTANALALDVTRYLQNEPVLARPPSTLYLLRKSLRRHRLAFAALAMVIAALAVGLGVAMSAYGQEKAARERAVLAEREQTKQRGSADTARARAVTAEREQVRLRQEAESHAKRAKIAADRSIEESRFANSILVSAAPSALREALDKRFESLSDNWSDHPEVQADLLARTGGSYMNLQKYERAEIVYQAALDLRQRVLGSESIQVVGAMHELAGALAARGKFTEAESLHRTGLGLRQRALGLEHADVDVSLRALSSFLFSRNRMMECEALLRPHLALLRQNRGENHPSLTYYMNTIAVTIRHDRTRWEEAENLAREALTLYRRHFGDAGATWYVHNLAVIQRDHGKWAEAEAGFRESFALAKQNFGADSHSAANEALFLGQVLNHQRKSQEAVTLLTEQLPIVRRLVGDEHSLLSFALRTLALSLRLEGKGSEADAAEREAAGMQKKAAAPDELSLAFVRGAAALYRQLGKLREAEEMHRKIVSMVQAQQGADSLASGDALTGLAELLVAAQKFAEAEPLARAALGLRQKYLGPTSWRIASNHSTLGGSLRGLGHWAEAEPLLLGAYAHLKEQEPLINRPYKVRVRNTAKFLALLYHDKGDAAKAAEWQRIADERDSPAANVEVIP
jgi:eukaryotic-like serine/threonine-protein kinase